MEKRNDQFADPLQLLARKMVGKRSKWKAEKISLSKTNVIIDCKFNIFSALVHKLLITGPWKMNFTEFRAHHVSIFGV